MESAKRIRIKEALEGAIEYLAIEQSYTPDPSEAKEIGRVLDPLKKALKDIKLKSEK